MPFISSKKSALVAIVYELLITLGVILIYAGSDLIIRSEDFSTSPWLIIFPTLGFILVDYFYIKDIFTLKEQIARFILNQIFLIIIILPLMLLSGEKIDISESHGSVAYFKYKGRNPHSHFFLATGQILALRSFFNQIVLACVALKTDYDEIVY